MRKRRKRVVQKRALHSVKGGSVWERHSSACTHLHKKVVSKIVHCNDPSFFEVAQRRVHVAARRNLRVAPINAEPSKARKGFPIRKRASLGAPKVAGQVERRACKDCNVPRIDAAILKVALKRNTVPVARVVDVEGL